MYGDPDVLNPSLHHPFKVLGKVVEPSVPCRIHHYILHCLRYNGLDVLWHSAHTGFHIRHAFLGFKKIATDPSYGFGDGFLKFRPSSVFTLLISVDFRYGHGAFHPSFGKPHPAHQRSPGREEAHAEDGERNGYQSAGCKNEPDEPSVAVQYPCPRKKERHATQYHQQERQESHYVPEP